MATGYMSHGYCWSTLQDATDTHFEYIQPFFTSSNIVEYVRQASGQWAYKSSTVNGSGVITQQYSALLPTPQFTTCTVGDLSMYDINPANILYVTSWGMGVILMMWALGYAVASAVKVINKL